MHWMVPEANLGEYQREVLGKCGRLHSNSQWIQGFAGSGKSVLLVHIAQRLLAEDPELSICITSFTHALKDLLKTGFAEHHEEKIEVMTYHQFLRDGVKYDLVLVDEIQDIPEEKLEKIKRLAKHIVVAGDNDQSIYIECSTPGEIVKVLNPETYRLEIIYRLTQKIKEIVQTILPNSQIENAPTDRMREVKITLAKAKSEDEEIQWVWEKCQRYAEVGDPSVILIPKHAEIQKFIHKICKIKGLEPPIFPRVRGRYDYEHTNELFENSDVPLQYLGNNFGELRDSDNRGLTYIMTYHSAKGLDFKNVFLPHLDEDLDIYNEPDLERRLFFVAMTRSRLNLFLSHSSEHPIHYVANFPQDLLFNIICGADLSEQQHRLKIPDEDVNHIKEEFIENVVEIFENRTDIKGKVITAIIERVLNDDEIEGELIAKYQEDQSFQDILSEIEESTDEKEAKDVYNQIGDIIENILEYDEDDDDDNETYETPF